MHKSLSLGWYNNKVLLKSLMSQMLVLALALAISVAFFGGYVDSFSHILQESDFDGFLEETLRSIMDGTFDNGYFTSYINEIITTVQDAMEQLGDSMLSVELAYVLAGVLVICYRLLVSITDVTVDCQLDEFMTSNTKRSFLWYFVKKQGKTWKFTVRQVFFTLPLDFLIVCGCLGFYVLVLLPFGWWTIIPIAVAGLVVYTARLTLFAFCLPAVACERNVHTKQAFRKGLSLVFSCWWKVFFQNLAVILLIVLINALAILFVEKPIFTLLLATFPTFALFFYLKCVNLVLYYQAQDKPFFYNKVYVEGTEDYLKRQRRKKSK